MSKNVELIVVIPVYNDAGNIEGVIASWIPILKKIDGQLIIVNDGSTDNTLSIVQEIAVHNPRVSLITKKNGGHGSAILAGYEWALSMKPNYIFQADGDGQFSMEDFWTFWANRNSYSMILGYRYRRADGIARYIVTLVLRLFLVTIYQASIKDANVPFRLIKAKFLQTALTQFNHHVLNPNIFISLISRYRPNTLKEFPIRHFPRKTGSSNLLALELIRACISSVYDLINFRVHYPPKIFSADIASGQGKV